MLYRGDTPLTMEEAFEYEIERELNRLCDAGLVLRTTRIGGQTVWSKTQRGRRELGSPDLDERSFESPS